MPRPKNTDLTRRESEVWRLLASGASLKEAASCLGIAKKTADVHRTNLYKKLGVHRIADLTNLAVERGVIAP